LEEYN